MLEYTCVLHIVCDGLGGLCEVASKSTLFYVDRAAKYLVIGRIYDMEARQDLTAARLLALNPDLLAEGDSSRLVNRGFILKFIHRAELLELKLDCEVNGTLTTRHTVCVVRAR